VDIYGLQWCVVVVVDDVVVLDAVVGLSWDVVKDIMKFLLRLCSQHFYVCFDIFFSKKCFKSCTSGMVCVFECGLRLFPLINDVTGDQVSISPMFYVQLLRS